MVLAKSSHRGKRLTKRRKRKLEDLDLDRFRRLDHVWCLRRMGQTKDNQRTSAFASDLDICARWGLPDQPDLLPLDPDNLTNARVQRPVQASNGLGWACIHLLSASMTKPSCLPSTSSILNGEISHARYSPVPPAVREPAMVKIRGRPRGSWNKTTRNPSRFEVVDQHWRRRRERRER